MLLAVDTSTPQIGLALYDGAQVLAESLWTSKARHTVELAPAVAEMLEHAGVRMSHVKALGVAIGPGSFTSLRVGISFVKGLAVALALPIVGVNTLEVAAAGQPLGNLPLVCVLPAGRGRLAACWFGPSLPLQDAEQRASSRVPLGISKSSHRQSENTWHAQGQPVILSADELSAAITQETVVCGDLKIEERQSLKKNINIRLVSPAHSTRRPAILAELGYTRWQAGSLDDISNLAPLYLHLANPIPDIASGTNLA